MSIRIVLGLLRETWVAYLLKQGHRVTKTPRNVTVVRSRNGSRGCYRWLLWVSENPTRSFSRPERAEIRMQLRQADRRRETAYLVVGFLCEPRRIVVVPAAAALKAGQVGSDKGGIAWEG